METQKQSFSRSQTSSNFIFETCSVVPTFFFSVDSPIHFRFLLLQVWITTTNPRPDFSVSHGVRHVKSLQTTMFRKLPHLVHRELPISHFSFRITPFTWHKGQRPWGWSPPKSQRYLGPKPPPALQCRPSNGNFISPQSGLMVADNP